MINSRRPTLILNLRKSPILSLILSAVLAVSQAVSASQVAEITPYDGYRKAGEQAFSANNYGVAEKNFLLALKEVEKLPLKDPRVADAYRNLSSLYEVRGQFPKAEAYLEKELRAREKSLGAEHPKVVTSVGKLARFYLLHGSSQRADRLCGLLTTFADRLAKQEESLRSHFHEIEKFFVAHTEFAEAEKKLKAAQESARKIQADDHLEFAACLDALAAAYKEKNKYANAESLYKKAMVLREKSLPPGHMALAFSYENLANLYTAMGKTELAQPLYRQSLQVTSKTLDTRRPEVFTRLDSLARTYISMGQESQAEQLYRQAIDAIKADCGPGSKDLGSASFALGQIYLKRGRSSDAEPLFKQALTIAESINGPQSANLVPILDSYADALGRNNKSSESAKYRNRASAIKGSTASSKVESEF